MGWQKDTPEKSGYYWTADRDRHLCGVQLVIYGDNGELVWAGSRIDKHSDNRWMGWWYTPSIEIPECPNVDWYEDVNK